MLTKSFWTTTLELMLLAGLSTFGASLAITTTPTLKDLEAALIAGGMAALYAFVKQLGGLQQAAGVLKVKVKAP